MRKLNENEKELIALLLSKSNLNFKMLNDLSNIDVIDLDDGVKVNYEKVQTGRDGKKLDVLAKI